MKVTLVHPPGTLSNPKWLPRVYPPLGMAYIAASLRQAGHTVLVVDGLGEGIGRQSHFRERYYSHGLTTDEIVERIDADTELIGIGIMFSHLWPIAKVLIGSLRARFPHAVIVCGGEHVTALPRFVMEDAPIDYAVIGEGEETLMELAAHLGGLPERLPLDRIAGLAYRCAGGSIASTPPRRRRRALDEIPWPAWDLFPLEGYLDTNLSGTHAFESSQRPMVILATRGCPYTCKFCSNEQMWGINYFMRDPKDVVDEMASYVQRYGVTEFIFQDLTLVINRSWADRLCDEITTRNLGITWRTASGTRSEALDLDLLQKIARSGCAELTLAPESGSSEIGYVTRKRVRLDKILEVARIVRDHDIPMWVDAQMIIGYPEERLRDVFKTYLYLVRMARAGFSNTHVHRFTAYPGSEYHDIAVRERRIVHNDDYFLSLARIGDALEMTFPFNRLSSHPRWSGGFILLLITIAYSVFFASYYLLHPREAARAVRGILRNRPVTRIERYAAYRLWGAIAPRQDATASAASGAATTRAQFV